MSKAHLTALVSAVLFLRWLATGHVALTVAGGITATVPALAGRNRGRDHRGRRRGGPDRVLDPGRARHARGLAGTEGGHPMTATTAMTKTEALAIARQARQYGHWADAGPDDPRAVSVDCPRCGQRVHAVREIRRASRGPLYESPGRALDRAMLAHLTGGWCAP